MYRTAMKRLLDWKNNPVRKPLLLFGARQVGKSYLLERFARENYQSYVLLNLEQSRGLRAAFEGDLSPRSVPLTSRSSPTRPFPTPTRSWYWTKYRPRRTQSPP